MSQLPERKSEHGQALVEFALTIPILLMFVLGIIDLARILYVFSQTINASRQAVRYGIVNGLEADKLQYLDCDGIRKAAGEVPGLVDVSKSQISVFYENSKGTKLKDCATGLTLWDVNDGDVLAVRVKNTVTPITPVLLMFTKSISLDYTSRRTIMAEGAAYTSDWPEPPAAPQNFRATVNCSQSSNNVSFAWTPLSPIPDRAEIRNSLTGDVVVSIDGEAPGLITQAYCNNCATISTTEGFGMYYLVSIDGQAPNEMAGPPSSDAVVQCSGTGGGEDTGNGTASISGTVFVDKDSGADLDNGEKSIEGVMVTLTTGGSDGTLGTADDKSFSMASNNKGEYSFTGLEVPYGFASQVFKISVDRTSSALGGQHLTTNNSPYSLTVSDGQAKTVNFGFNS
jgi:hypothetical protein